MKRALLFDLDDTLVVEESAAAASFAATADVASVRHHVDPVTLALAARERAREPTSTAVRWLGQPFWR
ncbi:MAG TPA: hypothetical protein VK701_05250 [Solirubrobacteraceae bacterium]|nr:hypothetical protein [Solirubrobacteraceae bacterium]